MEESATEGQQNYIQSKQCLVFSLRFAMLSNLRSRYGHYPRVKLAFFDSHEGHFVCDVKAAVTYKKKHASISTCV